MRQSAHYEGLGSLSAAITSPGIERTAGALAGKTKIMTEPIWRKAPAVRRIRKLSMSLQTATNRYASIASEIYDIDKPYGALPDTAFHLETLANISGPILEPACGSGRTLVPLLKAGHDVTGFDPSPEMLAQCRARCAEAGFDANVTEARFDTFAYDQKFACIIVPAGSFTLIDDFATAIEILKRFHAHLAPGGKLILDIQGLAFLQSRGDDLRQWETPSGDLLTLEGRRIETDWLKQRARTRYRYERWRETQLVESQIDIMSQRYWGKDEFALALRSTGFTDIRITGNYDRRRPLRSTDATMTFEALLE